MDFLPIVLSDCYAFGCRITNRFNTTITMSKNGIENRLKNWKTYLKRYSITYSVKSDNEIIYLRDFFNEVMGQYYGFLFKDYTDYKISSNDIHVKNIYKNYLRIYSKKTNRKIDSFVEDNFIDKSKIKEFDKTTGKVYLNPSSTLEVIENAESGWFNSVELQDFTQEDIEFLQKSSMLYANTDNGEIELKISQVVGNKVYYVNNFENSYGINSINIYNNTVNNIILPDIEVEYYHVVRFDNDDFMINMDDFNINSVNLELVELNLED